jgi:hypothetical protein
MPIPVYFSSNVKYSNGTAPFAIMQINNKLLQRMRKQFVKNPIAPLTQPQAAKCRKETSQPGFTIQ